MQRESEVAGRSTVYDVARRAGVSIATVSRYYSAPRKLSPATRDKVAEAIGELGYHQNGAARRLAGGSTRSIALCLPDFSDDDPPLDLTESDGHPRVWTTANVASACQVSS